MARQIILLGLIAVCIFSAASRAEGQLLGPAAESAGAGSASGPSQTPLSSPQRDVVLHAGGTVEFRLPRGWLLREVPYGREIRLLAGPSPLAEDPKNLRAGFWLAYHRSHPGSGLDEGAPEGRLIDRLRLATDDHAGLLGPPQTSHIGPWPSWRQEFESAAGNLPAEPPRRGFHLLSKTEHGLLEMHVIAPLREYTTTARAVAEITETLKLHRPAPPPAAAIEEVQPASRIIGTWKALKSRMELGPGGQIQIRYDRKATFAMDQQGSVVFDKKRMHLSGRYEAQRDVLYVAWDDGSRQNFRWKLYHGDLLLTDHTGRVSQLKRLFD